MSTLLSLWNELVSLAAKCGLEDGVYVVPNGLIWSRPAAASRGSSVPELPREYTEFIEAIGGVPVFGLEYYDRDGWSFLSRSAMEAISTHLPSPEGDWPKEVDGRAECPFAFFAGIELSDLDGWAMGPGANGGTVVWEVSGMPREEVGPFSEWMASMLERSLERIKSASEGTLEFWRTALEEEDDPHRLIDYSIERDLCDIAKRSDADRALHWTVSQAETPYHFGLIDDRGEWRIKPQPMYGVSPFTGGVAEVIFADEGSSYGGPWVKIRPDGSRVD